MIGAIGLELVTRGQSPTVSSVKASSIVHGGTLEPTTEEDVLIKGE